MTDSESVALLRCSRCGREADPQDKFCAECGMFLRDAFVDSRLLLALVHEKEGRSRDARRELEMDGASQPEGVHRGRIAGGDL